MISEEAQSIKDTLVRDTLNDTPINEKRQDWEEFAATVKTPGHVKVESLAISDVPCLLLRPPGCISNSVIVYIHGGGLVEGSVNTSREWCARLALAVDQSVLSIDYPLAPEYPFPAARDDVVSVCKAVSVETEFVLSSIGADSSGCALALNALLALRDSGHDAPASCFLLSPSIDFAFRGRSMELNATTDLVVASEVLEYYATLYVGNHNPASAEVSSLYADLHGLPRLLIHVDDSEILFDDAVRLEQKIRRQGGVVSLVVTKGLWHVWPTWCDFPEARIAVQQIVDHILDKKSE